MPEATLHAGYTISRDQQHQQEALQQVQTNSLVNRMGRSRPYRPSDSWISQGSARPAAVADLGQRLDEAVALPAPIGYTSGGIARILQRGGFSTDSRTLP